MCADQVRGSFLFRPTNEEGQCGEKDFRASGCNPGQLLGDTKEMVCDDPVHDGELQVRDDDYLNEWGLPELLVNRAITRCWSGTISSAESAVLGRLVLFTLSEGRYSVTVTVADFLEGWDENGERLARPDCIRRSTAKRALAALRRRGLITGLRVGNATRFAVNVDAIIEGGRAITAKAFGPAAAARVLW